MSVSPPIAGRPRRKQPNYLQQSTPTARWGQQKHLLPLSWGCGAQYKPGKGQESPGGASRQPEHCCERRAPPSRRARDARTPPASRRAPPPAHRAPAAPASLPAAACARRALYDCSSCDRISTPDRRSNASAPTNRVDTAQRTRRSGFETPHWRVLGRQRQRRRRYLTRKLGAAHRCFTASGPAA